MRRISIVAAAGIAALTLSGGIAAAQPTGTQTITINVGVTPMALTLSGEPPVFSVALDEAAINQTHAGSTLDFHNPSSQLAVAHITVQRSATALGGLILELSVADAASHTPAAAATWTAADQTAKLLATAIPLGTNAVAVPLNWTLSGAAPATESSLVTDFTYTISQ